MAAFALAKQSWGVLTRNPKLLWFPAVVVALFAGCKPPAPPPPPPPPTNQAAQLNWELCQYDHSKPRPAVKPGDAECAVLKVPADPSQKNGPVVTELSVVRRTATDAQNKYGTLVYFPPGPDASGVDQLVNDPTLGGLEKNFDLVSFNPRGVTGKFQLYGDHPKTQVYCEKPILVAAEPIRREPITTDEQLGKARVAGEAVHNSCVKLSSQLVDHLDAITAAQDIDTLRQSLGADQISIYAHGYGSLAAQAYLQSFGGHVRAAVLDAPVYPGLKAADFAGPLAGALEGAYQRFADWCAGEPTCPLGKQDPWQVYSDLADKAGGDGGLVNPAFPDAPVDRAYLNWQIDQILVKADYPKLANYLKALSAKQPFQDAPKDEFDPSVPVQVPTVDFRICQDINVRISPGDLDKVVQAEQDAAPHFGSSPYANRILASCLGFPSPANVVSIGPVSGQVLVISSTGDTRAPYAWAQTVAQKLGPSATLVGVDDATDTVKLTNAGAPAQAVANFLLSLKAPPPGTTLPPN